MVVLARPLPPSRPLATLPPLSTSSANNHFFARLSYLVGSVGICEVEVVGETAQLPTRSTNELYSEFPYGRASFEVVRLRTLDFRYLELPHFQPLNTSWTIDFTSLSLQLRVSLFG